MTDRTAELRELAERSGILLAVPCTVLGLAVGGPETAILGGLVGFFFGMSVRSVARTLAAGSTAR